MGSSVLVRAPSFWKPRLWMQLEDSTSITSQLLLKRYCTILLLFLFFLYVVVVVVVTIIVSCVFDVFVVTIVVVVRFCVVVVVALLLWLSRLMFLCAAVVVIVVTIVIVVVVVRVYIKQGETVLTDSGDVYDITLTGGRLGMIAFGQQDVIWSRLEASAVTGTADVTSDANVQKVT